MEPSELLPLLIRTLEGLKLPYFITGSTATILYGEPRFTNDIDIVVDLPSTKVDTFCAAFPAPTFYCPRPAVVDAVARKFQFNILAPETGMKVDVIVASNSKYDALRMARAMRHKDASGTEGSYASPEDVIVKKMSYFKEGGSDKHLRDITGMLKTPTTRIDRNYVALWANHFGCIEIWREIVDQVDRTRDT